MREFFDAVAHVHYPESNDDLMPNAKYIVKLAYWELLAHQTAIAISRRNRRDPHNRRVVRPIKHNLMDKFRAVLPFALTGAQQRTIDEIFADMAAPVPMMRLVQGDVGSGKTIVAMAAAVRMASTMTNPKSRYSTSSENSACVPITSRVRPERRDISFSRRAAPLSRPVNMSHTMPILSHIGFNLL